MARLQMVGEIQVVGVTPTTATVVGAHHPIAIAVIMDGDHQAAVVGAIQMVLHQDGGIMVAIHGVLQQQVINRITQDGVHHQVGDQTATLVGALILHLVGVIIHPPLVAGVTPTTVAGAPAVVGVILQVHQQVVGVTIAIIMVGVATIVDGDHQVGAPHPMGIINHHLHLICLKQVHHGVILMVGVLVVAIAMAVVMVGVHGEHGQHQRRKK
jgi:hypothetical protein